MCLAAYLVAASEAGSRPALAPRAFNRQPAHTEVEAAGEKLSKSAWRAEGKPETNTRRFLM